MQLFSLQTEICKLQFAFNYVLHINVLWTNLYSALDTCVCVCRGWTAATETWASQSRARAIAPQSVAWPEAQSSVAESWAAWRQQVATRPRRCTERAGACQAGARGRGWRRIWRYTDRQWQRLLQPARRPHWPRQLLTCNSYIECSDFTQVTIRWPFCRYHVAYCGFKALRFIMLFK